jgi:hypothetical protein
MEAYGGVYVYIHIFFTSALAGGEWSTSCPGRFTSRGKSPLYLLYRRLGGPQSRVDHAEKRKFLTLPGLELQPLGRPALSYTD